MISDRWSEACTHFANSHGLPLRMLKLIDSFGSPASPQPAEAAPSTPLEAAPSTPSEAASAPPTPPSFDAIERSVTELLPDLPARVESSASGQVDSAQAAMFARRCSVLCELLDRLASRFPEGRLLRAGFVCRLDELLNSVSPPLRLRAIIDFYYSHASVLHHVPPVRPQRGPESSGKERSALPAPWELAAGVRWVRVTRGLFAGSVEGMSRRGPTRISLLRFDRLRFTYRCIDARSPEGAGIPLEQLAASLGAVAAFSGGFFLYSETDVEPPARRFDPVGLIMTEGTIVAPPIYRRPALVQDAEGRVHLLHLGMKDIDIELPGGLMLHPAAVNSRAAAARSPVVFNRCTGSMLRGLPGYVLRFSAGQFVGASLRDAAIPTGGFVVALPPGSEWEAMARSFEPGAAVRFHLARRPGPVPVHAMAGGPTLLTGGRPVLPLEEEDFAGTAEPCTFTQDETGDQNLLPRMAVGLTADHEVVVAAVDGRNFDRALGLTLGDVSSVMRAVGCTQAINLDGGSSKRLVADGRVLDLPSTDILGPGESPGEVRPVHTAVLALPR